MKLKHILLFTALGLITINSYANTSVTQDKSESTVKIYDLIPRDGDSKENPDLLLKKNSEFPLSPHSKQKDRVTHENPIPQMKGKWPPEDPSWEPE